MSCCHSCILMYLFVTNVCSRVVETCVYFKVLFCFSLPYSGLFSLGANFPDLEIHEPYY